MSRFAVLPFVLFAFVSALAAQQPAPPVAEKIARVDTLHGDVRTDN